MLKYTHPLEPATVALTEVAMGDALAAGVEKPNYPWNRGGSHVEIVERIARSAGSSVMANGGLHSDLEAEQTVEAIGGYVERLTDGWTEGATFVFEKAFTGGVREENVAMSALADIRRSVAV